MNPLRTFINLILPLKLLLTRNVTQKYRTHSVAYTADQAVYLRPFPRRDINTTSAASRVTTARWPKTQQQLAQVIFDEVKLSRVLTVCATSFRKLKADCGHVTATSMTPAFTLTSPLVYTRDTALCPACENALVLLRTTGFISTVVVRRESRDVYRN